MRSAHIPIFSSPSCVVYQHEKDIKTTEYKEKQQEKLTTEKRYKQWLKFKKMSILLIKVSLNGRGVLWVNLLKSSILTERLGVVFHLKTIEFRSIWVYGISGE